MARHNADTSPAQQPNTQEQPRKVWSIVLPALLVLVGVLVLIYPVVSTQVHNIAQERVAENYAKIVSNQPVPERSIKIDSAQRYNREHPKGPILDPWLARVSVDNRAYQDYLQELRDGESGVMSQLIIPKAEVNLPIYHGSETSTLEKGVGHLFGSSLPVGGPDTHAILTGHTGLTNATLFDNLSKIKVGDVFYLNTFGQKMKYEVDQIKVVLPEETDDLKTIPGEDHVTLITCTPYGINTHRLLVRGIRVELDAAEEAEAFTPRGLTWQWWMIASIAVAVIVLLATLLWLLRALAKNRRLKKQAETNTGLEPIVE